MNSSLLEIANPRKSFKQHMYTDALNYTECDKQMKFLANSSFLLPFVDATGKLPSGLLGLNHVANGNYFECLSIDNHVEGMHIQGKYCSIYVPVTQNITMLSNLKMTEMPGFSFEGFSSSVPIINVILNSFDESKIDKSLIAMQLGTCIPKVCSVKQVGDYIMSIDRVPEIQYIEGLCRLPGDKTFSTADYVAFGVFGILFLLTLLSTCYDLYNIHVKKYKPKSKLLTAFSLYTNTKRLLTFKSNKFSLECVDGIRSLSMIWVVIGHTYLFRIFFPLRNILDVLEWSTNFSSVLITASPIIVDTFFMLSGLFCIYTLPLNFTPWTFFKTLHLFYINRYWRTLPVLAVTVLLQVSILNWVTDGPDWEYMAYCVDACKNKWWATLLHMQNFLRPIGACTVHSWYVSVDTQLYLLSPIVIISLLFSSTLAWVVLIASLVTSLLILLYVSIYYDYPTVHNGLWQTQNVEGYFIDFYINPITRASPFVVGLIYGYIFWLHKKKGRIHISMKYVILGWTASIISVVYIYLTVYSFNQLPYKFDLHHVFFNVTMRALWAAVMGWIVLACTQGYGGPLNWFLSLSMWKLPSRVSYAVYLLHVLIIEVSASGAVEPQYFTEIEVLYNAGNFILISLICGIIVTVLVESPLLTIYKLFIDIKCSNKDPPEDCAVDSEALKTKFEK